jgi:transposase
VIQLIHCVVLIRVDRKGYKMDQEETRVLVIKEYLAGGVSFRSLGKRYKCHHSRIQRWIMAEKKQTKKRELLNQGSKPITPLLELEMSTDVRELQEELRISRIKILLLEATIDISDEQFGTSMRKKVGARQS